MVLTFFSLVLFTPIGTSVAYAFDDATCDRVEKKFAELEGTISCSTVRDPKNAKVQEFQYYKSMCYGCDPNYGAHDPDKPQTKFIGNDNHSKNIGFVESVEGTGTTTILGQLNRIPSSQTIIEMIYPELAGGKCGDAKFKAANSDKCAAASKLWDTAFTVAAPAPAGKKKKKNSEGDATTANALELISNANSTLDDAESACHNAVQAAIDSGDFTNYHDTCAAQNGQFKIASDAYNSVLGAQKKAIWANLLNEVAIRGNCIAHYVAAFPRYWCGTGANSAAADQEGCVKSLKSNPGDLFEKFKKFASDPVTLAERANQKKNDVMGEKTGQNQDKALTDSPGIGTGGPRKKQLPGEDATKAN